MEKILVSGEWWVVGSLVVNGNLVGVSLVGIR